LRRQMTVLFEGHIFTRAYTQNVDISTIKSCCGLVVEETKEFIFSPFGLVAIRNNGRVNAVATDHLGSIVAEFNPNLGEFEFFGYTAWGRRYRYEQGHKHFFDSASADWAFVTDFWSYPESILDFFRRGFTGHEHLDLFGLINMNGRLYDPIIARFLSPDPFVQDPTFSQNFNRFSYVWNNPLRFTDPTGYIIEGLRNVWGGITNFFSSGIPDFFGDVVQNISSWFGGENNTTQQTDKTAVNNEGLGNENYVVIVIDGVPWIFLEPFYVIESETHRPWGGLRAGANFSVGGQAGATIGIGRRRFGLSGNINSINLLEGSVGIVDRGLSFDGYVLDNWDIRGNRGVTFAHLSYNYSFRSRRAQVLSGYNVHSVSIPGYIWRSDGSSTVRLSLKLAIIFGIKIYIELP